MTLETIRALNEAGLQDFMNFIEQTRASEKAGKPRLPAPMHLLASDDKTAAIKMDVKLDSTKRFNDRYELAKYLNSVLDPAFDDAFYDLAGLWAWLALFYFDQLQAAEGNTQRSEHFIPDEWAKKTPGQDLGYRHSVRTPLMLLRRYGEQFARFFLTGRPTYQMGDIVEQFVSRPKALRSDRVRATMLKLYQSKTGGFKKGAATRPAKSRKSNAGRGGIRRFAGIYVPRVKLGFDIDEMEVDEIITTCGSEISGSRFVIS